MKKKFEAKDWLKQTPAQPEPISRPATTNTEDAFDDVEIVTQRIESARVDITSTYERWRDIGFAFSDELGEAGRDYFHRVSRFYAGYSEQEADSQYDKCMRAHGTGVTIKTFFQYAKEAGISVSIPSKSSNTSFPSFSHSEGSAPSFAPSEVSEGNEVIEGEYEDVGELPTFSESIASVLPDLLQKVVARADSPEDGDILILGTLAVISACLPNVMGIYDSRPVWANLFLFVTAKASSGKGRLALCRYLIEPIHENLRQLNQEELEIYKEEMQRYNATKKKETAQKPDEPPLRMLFIPANSSATAVYQVMNDNDGQGIMFETEGDTLANTFSSDYGNYSDGFRKAFHHEAISYVRRKDREYVNLKRPKLSTVLSGTPKQLLSLIVDAENGLFSRFIFYYLRTKLVWKDVFRTESDTTLDEHFERLGEEFNDFYTTLKEFGDIRFELTKPQQNSFNKWFEPLQYEYVQKYGEEVIASIRRLGLITFRIAMILSALRIMDDGNFEHTLVCIDDDFNSAMIIAQVLVFHTTKVLRELPKAATAGSGNSQKTVRRQLFLDKLPGEFDRKTFVDVAAELGIPLKTAERNIKQWCDQGIIIHLDQGKYKKSSR